MEWNLHTKTKRGHAWFSGATLGRTGRAQGGGQERPSDELGTPPSEITSKEVIRNGSEEEGREEEGREEEGRQEEEVSPSQDLARPQGIGRR
jgi:hypothetical protein